jgi:DNA adenine methylase
MAETATTTKLDEALAHVQDLTTELDSRLLAKTIWASPAGKKRLASRLAAMLPEHQTYVEPFAGSGAVLFAKEPCEVEVLNDADPEIAEAFRAIKRLTEVDLDKLQAMDWTGSPETFARLKKASPTTDLDRLHRFLYLSHFSFGKLRGRSFNFGARGMVARTAKRLAEYAPRLREVRVHCADYEAIVAKYDRPDTVFFLDPPYAGYDVAVGERQFDEVRFFEVLKSIKGSFLLTYGLRGKLPNLLEGAEFHVQRIQVPRTVGRLRGTGESTLTQLVVTNYEPAKVAQASKSFTKSVSIIKGTAPQDERFVLGIVLEPEVVDAQGDIYSAEEVRQAAHRFMEQFGELGLMHRQRLGDQVKVVETYLAPTNFTLGDVPVRQGTWLLAVRILDDELWQHVKEGQLTGFSVGGTARSATTTPTPEVQ